MSKNSALPLSSQAYEILKERIMNLHLRPGELLLVQPLSKDLGMSRTPVREALIRLEREGFINEAEGKKFRVTEVTVKSILEIHEVRELIELHTVSKAATKCSPSQLRKLQKLTKEMKNALIVQNHIKFFQLDMDFHALLISIADNKTLENLMFHLNEKVQRIRHLTTYVYQRLEHTIDEHNAILKGVETKDPSTAQKAMQLHLDQVKDGLVKLFEDQTMSFLGGVIPKG
jgi:DNA-binding GntR family transcriptional regulator